MYGDDEQYREDLDAAKKQWLKANNLYKKLLQKRSSVLGGHVMEEPRADPSSQFQDSSLHKLAPKPKKRRSIINDDDGDEDLPASSSSTVLEDGLYCLPLTDKPLSPSTAAAIVKAQEEDDKENADDEEFF